MADASSCSCREDAGHAQARLSGTPRREDIDVAVPRPGKLQARTVSRAQGVCEYCRGMIPGIHISFCFLFETDVILNFVYYSVYYIILYIICILLICINYFVGICVLFTICFEWTNLILVRYDHHHRRELRITFVHRYNVIVTSLLSLVFKYYIFH